MRTCLAASGWKASRRDRGLLLAFGSIGIPQAACFSRGLRVLCWPMNTEVERVGAGGAEAAFPETADIETSNDDYATRFRGAVGAWLLAVQERGTLRLLRNLPRGASILDVGGGHAQLAGPLCREGYRVTVLGSAESCRHRLEPLLTGACCSFQVGNVVALPFDDDSFDAVVCFRLLTHCGQWETLVRELCRVSRGPVVVDYPTSQSLNAVAPALFAAKKKVEKNTRTWRLFRHNEIRGAFAAVAYAETARFGQFFLPMVLHRAVRCRPLSAFLEGLCRVLGLSRKWGTPVIVRMDPMKQA